MTQVRARRHKVQEAVDRCGLAFVWLFGAAAVALSADGLPQFASDEYHLQNIGTGTLYAAAIPLELIVSVIIIRWINTRGGWAASRRGLLVIPAAVVANLSLQLPALHLGIATII